MSLDEPIETIAPWDGRRVPVTLVGGYLGAGKTTLINELLARTDRPIAVLVNDVGQVNVDAALVKRRSSDTLELTDGCVCCSLAEGLSAAFDGLRARPEPPDHVVIELSGVADPLRVAPWGDSDGFRLEGIIVLVDVDQLPDRLADPLTAPLLRGQLEAADLVVLTKADLVDADRRHGATRQVGVLAPGVPMVEAGTAGAAALLDLGSRRPGGVATIPERQLFDPHEVALVPLPFPATIEQLHQVLDALPSTTVRAKGIAVAASGERLLVQQVGSRRLVTSLPAAEDQPPTELVVITVTSPP